METTNTERPAGLPEGHYKMTISEVPIKKRSAKGTIYYAFKFETVKEKNLVTYTERFFPWAMQDLLKAIGGKEIGPNKWEWDRDAVVGKQIDADLIHEPDKNDPSKKWSRLKNITEAVPF